MRDRGYMRLVCLYGLYFVALGTSAYTSVFLAGRGMDNAQIGMLCSIPPIIALVLQPLWGLAGDRAKYKKNVLALAFLLTGLVCFLFDVVDRFVGLMVVMILYNCVSQAISPAAQTICMEYSADTKLGFGPIRMSGSITYQIALLATGFILKGSMPEMYRIMGVIFVLCAGYSLFAPSIEGHQHEKSAHVSPLVLFKDKRIVFLLSMTFCGKMAGMFYMSFYNKYIQEAYGNNIMSILAFLSVVMEIPFLLFSNKIMKKLKITYWVLIGFAVTSLRLIGITLTRSLPVLVLLQLPAVTVMGCFEFFPSLYMNSITSKELLGSVQSFNTLVTFGITQLFGSLLGGLLADWLGLQTVFGIYGGFLLVALIIYIVPARRADMDWDAPPREAGAPLFKKL